MQQTTKSSRDIRQEQCVSNWVKAKGLGTIVGATGFGKTRCALIILDNLIKKRPNLIALIVVPTITLKEQWAKQIDKLGFSLNCDIQVINTVITRDWECDLLIIDEIHSVLAESFAQVFKKVKYKLVLGLTATFERLDGRHEICKQYCPVCDTVPITECLINGWVSPYKEYLVLIDVEDIDTYLNYNKEFIQHYEYFNFDYDKIKKLLGKQGFIEKAKLRDEMCPKGSESERLKIFREITYHSQRYMQLMQARKKFINNHPKKIELTQKIIAARPNSKIITFSNSIAMAESIGMGGKVYSGKDSKKKGRTTIEEFSKATSGTMHTIKKCDAGLDLPGLSVGIVIGTDSSSIKAAQRLGRVCRKEDNKQAEVFYIILDNTVEVKWFTDSHKKQPYITIDEEGLEAVLKGEEPKPYTKKIRDFQFRY